MDNSEIADKLTELANLLDISGENPFRVRSYRWAVRAIESSTLVFEQMVRNGQRLTNVDGIGKSIADKMVEIVRTGTCAALEEARQAVNPNVIELLRLEGLGPKKVKKLHEELEIETVDELEAAILDGRLKDVAGFGGTMSEKLTKAIAHFRTGIGRFRLDSALEIGETILDYLSEVPGIERMELAGSLRRRKESVGDLDILVICEDSDAVIGHFLSYWEVDQVLTKSSSRASVRLDFGIQVDCLVVPRESFGAAMHYFTGSQSHNIAVRARSHWPEYHISINEMGVHHRDTGDFICGATEAEVFEAVGLRYIPPEIRENIGEVEAAEEDRLPELVELSDIRGDLHMHTTETDGRNTIIEMAECCQSLGYEYMAITDHSKAMAIANGLDAQRLAAQFQEIDKANYEVDIRILRAIEVDILRDGSLDLDDGILAECEWVIASVHSHMQISAEEMTTRLLRAIENPNVCAIAHPTARLILEREGYSFDTVRVFEAARDAGVCMEINANPARLDLKDVQARQVRELGGRLVINTDAHFLRELYNMRFGVWTARRGWIGPADVLNTLSLEALLDAKRKR